MGNIPLDQQVAELKKMLLDSLDEAEREIDGLLDVFERLEEGVREVNSIVIVLAARIDKLQERIDKLEEKK